MQGRQLILGAAGALFVCTAATTATAAPGDKIQGQYICVFKKGVVAKGKTRAESERAAGQGLKHVYSNTIRGFAASANSAAQLQSRNPNIAYCEQDQEVGIEQGNPFDFRELGKKPAPQQPSQTIPWGVTRVGGGAGTGTPTGKAWVIDSGIDLDHPDLVVDVASSRNFSTGASADDGNGHGTHVAGTIAARADNNIGVVGVTPGATVVAVRVLNNAGSGTNSGVIAGVDYVAGAANGQGVANMSLGGGVSQALDDAVIAAALTGLRFTIAAGNSATDANNSSPARANAPNIYTVSSFAKGTSELDTDDPWSSFSNYGSSVDNAEPGSSIPSTYKGGGYATLSGTSMAAPHLAGILLTRATPASTSTVDNDPDGNADKIGTK
jgi:subtilisin family serine protease